MYAGKIVELAPTNKLFKKQYHPYTEALLSAIPIPNPDKEIKPKLLEGEVPSLINPPDGCRFHPRCNKCKPNCLKCESELIEISKEHYVACNC
jgi:oligopeptide/dipeptide ABC transporter ATP-binding protein